MAIRVLICVVPLLLLGCSEPAPEPKTQEPADAKTPPPDFILDSDAVWETVAQGYVYSDSPAVTPEGDIYYSANTQNRILHLTVDDQVELFDKNTALTMGLMFGSDGRLYGCRNLDAQIVAYDMQGGREVLLQGELSPLENNPDAPGEFCNDLVVSSKGQIWFTDRVNRGVKYLNAAGEAVRVTKGFRPNGLALSADETLLAVTDSLHPRMRAFDIAADGSLTERVDFFAPINAVTTVGKEESARGRPGTNGMTVDSDGRFYVTSYYGIQIFDANGAYIGVIESPAFFTSNIAFGGADFSVLYATGLNGLYRIQTKVTGAPYFLRSD